jgi:hypothetical protein
VIIKILLNSLVKIFILSLIFYMISESVFAQKAPVVATKKPELITDPNEDLESTPLPEETVTATATPEVTNTANPTATASFTATVNSEITIQPTQTATPNDGGQTPLPTLSSTPKTTATIVPTVTSAPTFTSTPIIAPTRTPLPTPFNTPFPTPFNTATPIVGTTPTTVPTSNDGNDDEDNGRGKNCKYHLTFTHSVQSKLENNNKLNNTGIVRANVDISCPNNPHLETCVDNDRSQICEQGRQEAAAVLRRIGSGQIFLSVYYGSNQINPVSYQFLASPSHVINPLHVEYRFGTGSNIVPAIFSKIDVRFATRLGVGNSSINSANPTPTTTASVTITPTSTNTPILTGTPTQKPSGTPTVTSTPTITANNTPTITPTIPPTPTKTLDPNKLIPFYVDGCQDLPSAMEKILSGTSRSIINCTENEFSFIANITFKDSAQANQFFNKLDTPAKAVEELNAFRPVFINLGTYRNTNNQSTVNMNSQSYTFCFGDDCVGDTVGASSDVDGIFPMYAELSCEEKFTNNDDAIQEPILPYWNTDQITP